MHCRVKGLQSRGSRELRERRDSLLGRVIVVSVLFHGRDETGSAHLEIYTRMPNRHSRETEFISKEPARVTKRSDRSWSLSLGSSRRTQGPNQGNARGNRRFKGGSPGLNPWVSFEREKLVGQGPTGGFEREQGERG